MEKPRRMAEPASRTAWEAASRRSITKLSRPGLRGLPLVVVVVEQLLADAFRDEDLLQIVQRGQGKRDAGGREGGAHRGEREMARLLGPRVLRVFPIENASVIAEDHPVDVGEEHAEPHLASPDETFSG